MRSTFVRSMWLDHRTKSDSPGVTVSDTWMFLISALSAALLGAAPMARPPRPPRPFRRRSSSRAVATSRPGTSTTHSQHPTR